ncbi:PREDICTED: uncharacterized protein LOC109340623 [Lupinus angustifolius]|uniref:uncharacterized protein LOC109340623 n=1 Tax=Lupinus angustifolius TaxID=3871 RepID=UPI00092E435E|nr:PREDICTED: uncharacterized protein LOC109340623 [Lupinus angustifolius]
MDVNSAFLNGPLETEVFVTQPPGFENIESAKGNDKSDLLIVCLYVDDLLITSGGSIDISTFKQQMQSEFEMSDLGELAYFLGIEFKKTKLGIFMHQSKYTSDVLKMFQIRDCNPTTTPVEVGDVTNQDVTKPDVDKTFHGSSNIVGFSNADWCRDRVDRKSTIGYLFCYGDAPFSWCSKKQDVVALSSCEVEYVATCMCSCQVVWLEALFGELRLKQNNGI